MMFYQFFMRLVIKLISRLEEQKISIQKLTMKLFMKMMMIILIWISTMKRVNFLKLKNILSKYYYALRSYLSRRLIFFKIKVKNFKLIKMRYIKILMKC
jgi:hypothetical protein